MQRALDRRFDPIAALIQFSADLKTESDVEWVCAELEKRDHGNPFAFFQLQYGLAAANGRRKASDTRVGRVPLSEKLKTNSGAASVRSAADLENSDADRQQQQSALVAAAAVLANRAERSAHGLTEDWIR